jgi:hypothetical protein
MVETNKREIPREKWLSFFDKVSSKIQGKGADVTLLSDDGAQHQSTLWQLHGVTYDPHDDALIVSCRQQEHVIQSPTSIAIEGFGREMQSVEVATKSGGRETVRFMSPLLIPAP